MSGLKLNDSIFDTSTDKYDNWDFNIIKDTTGVNNTMNNDMSSNTTTPPVDTTNNNTWWDGIGDFVNIGNTETNIGNTETNTGNTSTTKVNDSMFSGANIGSTLKGGGAVVGALSSVYGTLEQTKFNKEALGMEKDRINRNIAREDKIQKNYQGVWA